LSLIFSVTEQAAARLDPQALYSTLQWRDASGDYFTVYVDEYVDGGSAAANADGNMLDLSDVEAVTEGDSEENIPQGMLARYAVGELR
jgi:hypothetical protein